MRAEQLARPASVRPPRRPCLRGRRIRRRHVPRPDRTLGRARGRDEHFGTRGQDRMRTTARRRPIERASLARRCVAFVAIAAVSLGCVADASSYSGVARVADRRERGPGRAEAGARRVGRGAAVAHRRRRCPPARPSAPVPTPDRPAGQRRRRPCRSSTTTASRRSRRTTRAGRPPEAPVHHLRRPAGGVRGPARLALVLTATRRSCRATSPRTGTRGRRSRNDP